MSATSRRPLIGCTTYRKTTLNTQIDVYGLMPSYSQAITAAGGIPVLIPLGLSEDDLRAVLERVDGLLLPGGGDINPARYNGRAHPTVGEVDEERDRVELFMARTAVSDQKPLLAICRGHQVLNVALGGTLWEDVDSMLPNSVRHNFNLTHPRTHLPHEVQLAPGSRLAHILGRERTPVNSLHHQGVRDLAPELAATGWSADGLVEGCEAPGHPFAVSVQWHPENLIHNDPAMLNLFTALTAAAARR